jgi:hypothetical protein
MQDPLEFITCLNECKKRDWSFSAVAETEGATEPWRNFGVVQDIVKLIGSKR